MRRRLIERLSEGLHRKLALISAPAGFGKTTLVTEWLAELRGEADNDATVECRTAWLSLDDSDNDPIRFLTYFIAALSQIGGMKADFGKGMISSVQSPQPPSLESAMTSLINEITAVPDQIILTLDDYHLISAQPIHRAISFLLENLPPRFQLVIVTREDPPLPLSRLRARDQLTELRAADLRFSTAEAAEFLNQVMGLGLSAEDIAALETRTEGWIAGLQLAAVSLQGHTDKSQLIQSFTGSHRLVLDYLVEEVLNQQPDEITSFLLQTSILDRLRGPLCDAVTGEDNGQVILETLEHANLFIIPLDSDRRWYRYHHLFGDLLRQRLRRTQSNLIPILNGRASEWYEQRDMLPEAIRFALASHNFARAAGLIETQVDAMWLRGEHSQLQSWLSKLPDDLICARPHLCIYHAWYLYASGQHDAATHILKSVEEALNFDSDQAQLRGRVYAIRAFMETHQGDAQGIIQFASQALEYLPEQDSTWRSISSIVLGDAYGFEGDMRAAYTARAEALQICRRDGMTYYSMLASMKLAITLRELGQLHQTVEICRQQSEMARELGLTETSLAGLIHLIEGEALAELNLLEKANLLAQKGDRLLARAVDLAFFGWGYMCLLRILFSSRKPAAAEEVIRRMEPIERGFDVPPWVMNQMAAWQTRIRLQEANSDTLSKWVSARGLALDGEFKPKHELDYFLLSDYILLARVFIAQNELQKAIALLKHLFKIAEANGRISSMIEILSVCALALHARGDKTEALTTLSQALEIAEPGGFVRVFVDEGPPMANLLYEALSRGIAPGYVRRLLSALPLIENESVTLAAVKAGDNDLIEPLSERELEVLQLIGEGMTNPEIADRLFLSLNTVKVHTRNIYGKLGVNNRTQAVARGRALGVVLSA
ncbi:MAG: hypothetical protein J5I90_21940 [Caldilineales bacterium]|nr:hypothetical protein [Caldilineales bacterium]